MSQLRTLDAESDAVRTHLTILQGIIQRIADNSRSCKVWNITLVSGILVLVARADRPDYLLIALVPTLLFLVLDTYYLALERGFRQSYSDFVHRLHEGILTPPDLYTIESSGSVPRHFLSSLASFSIWPFYPTLVILVLVVWGLLA